MIAIDGGMAPIGDMARIGAMVHGVTPGTHGIMGWDGMIHGIILGLIHGTTAGAGQVRGIRIIIGDGGIIRHGAAALKIMRGMVPTVSEAISQELCHEPLSATVPWEARLMGVIMGITGWETEPISDVMVLSPDVATHMTIGMQHVPLLRVGTSIVLPPAQTVLLEADFLEVGAPGGALVAEAVYPQVGIDKYGFSYKKKTS